VADQQKYICTQIVAAEELLLQELILLWGEWTWQGVGRAWDILAQQKVSQFKMGSFLEFYKKGLAHILEINKSGYSMAEVG
jgi:hypothetical protein